MTTPTETPNGATSADVLLEATGVVKTYGAVTALSDGSLEVRPGEVHALMGANGAGKSTLVKILTGAVHPDRGRIAIRGQIREVHSPSEARANGLVPVYQEPALIPDLDVGANLRLTNTPPDIFMERLQALGVPRLDLNQMVGDIPLAVIRVMDLARAMSFEPDVLLLDEMTAALPADLAESVLEQVGRYREGGRSVIFISHRLLEINALCDRATVLRDGATVGIVDMGPGAEEEIVSLMLGPAEEGEQDIHTSVVSAAASTEDTGTKNASEPATPRLKISNLKAGTKMTDVSFELYAGEVLGLVALEGQGQDELFSVLSGASTPDGGGLEVNGEPIRHRPYPGLPISADGFGHPAEAIAAGLVLVPGDRVEGLLMQRSVRENIALPYTAPTRDWGPISMGKEKQMVDMAVQRLQIDTRAQGEVRQLSGGNQQKVTIARWIAGGVQTLLCFDPTRGIDVGTKRQIYHLLRELAADGSAVLLYTSELEEVQLACDRAVIIFNGVVVDEMPAEIADEAALMRAAYGLPREDEAAGSSSSEVTA